MWPRTDAEEGQEEPDWIKSERDQFANYRDKNKDGKMDKDEIMHWIIPADFDHSRAEAKHLLYEADVSKVFCKFSRRERTEEHLVLFLSFYVKIILHSMEQKHDNPLTEYSRPPLNFSLSSRLFQILQIS